MKPSKLNLFYLLMFLAAPVDAADSLTVNWNRVCQVAGSRELVITTAGGETIEGACVSINVDEIAISTKDRKVVKIARQTLATLELRRMKGHQLRSLRSGMRQELHMGIETLFSPLAPVGMVVIPGTLAWGAVAAPFCAIGDLAGKLAGTLQIKPI